MNFGPYALPTGGVPPPVGGGVTLQPHGPNFPAAVDLGGFGTSTGPAPFRQGFDMSPFGGMDDVINGGTRTIGTRPNEVVASHYVVTPDQNDEASEGMVKALGIGMLLFARNWEGAPPGAQTRFRQTSHVLNSKNSTQFLEWSQLLRWLHKHGDRYETASEVLNEWKFAGGLKVEVAPNSQNTYGRRPASRVINATVKGPFETFNVFGQRLQTCDKLYFICKKVDDQAAQRFEIASSKKRKLGARAWTLEPWAGRAAPSAKDLAYEDDDGTIRMGEAIDIGTVNYAEPDCQMGPIRRTDVSNTIALFNRGLLAKVEVFLRV